MQVRLPDPPMTRIREVAGPGPEHVPCEECGNDMLPWCSAGWASEWFCWVCFRAVLLIFRRDAKPFAAHPVLGGERSPSSTSHT
jgi:hypothetical protein